MYQKILILTLILSFFAVFRTYSQTPNSVINCTVKGVLVDSISGEPIPYVTISVSAASKPDVYIKRQAADVKGNFELVLTKSDQYMITFESVGMQKLQRKIELTNQKLITLGKINMSVSNSKLSEVTVTANKPLVKVELDKISYDTKSDPESKSTNVLDMLRKVPLVTVDGEDNIQLKGSSNFKVFVNGKPSSMTATNPSQVLKSMPASSIKNIEVITDPGAKYEAEGLGGIINIVTEKAVAGYTGTVRAGGDTNGGYTGGLFFSTKKGKFGITSNLNFNKHVQPDRNFTLNRENEAGASSNRYLNQSSSQDVAVQYFYGNLEASYEIDSLNLLSFNVGGHNGGHNVDATVQTSSLNDLMDTLLAYNQLTKATGTWGGVEMTLDYQRSYKKPEKLFTLSYKLSNTPNNTDNYSEYTGLKNYSDSKQKIISNAQGNEHTFQIDYVEPFNKKNVVELGTKYIVRLNNSVNTYNIFNTENNRWDPIPGRTSKDMNHTQNILGAYGSYTLRLKLISIKAGLRFEHTSSDVEFIDSPVENFKVNFTNFVPSAALTYKLNDFSNLRFTYNQRISRPGISYLNPFLDDSNPQSILKGNPELDPEINNSFSVNFGQFTPKVNFNASLYTSFTNNSIQQVSELQPTGIIYSTYKNIGHNNNTGLSLYGNVQLSKKIRVNANGSATYIEFDTNDGSGIENSGMRYTISAGAQFILPWELKLNINGGYYSPGVSLQGTNPSFHYSTLSLGKDFLKKKLNVTVRVMDPFESTKKLNFMSETNLYYQATEMIMPGRYFGLNVSYNFGEMKERIKKAQRTITNDDVKAAENPNTSTQQ